MQATAELIEMKIDIVGGARPNFVKIASIMNAFQQIDSGKVSTRLIHTGQHYDAMLSDNFFTDLNIPNPDFNMAVRSGSQAEQTGKIMLGYEQLVAESRPNLCIVVGDVNSTMACAISARKCGVDVAHVEAGIRSGDWSMPEEINRVVTDSISNWFYTTTEEAGIALSNSGIGADRIEFVGNTMIDTLLRFQKSFEQPECWEEFKLQKENYFIVTLHRPSNVDQQDSLIETLKHLSEAVDGNKIVFPVHPRTASILKDKIPKLQNIHFTDPLPYLKFNYLVKHSIGVITDSGGITEETTVMGIPTITLRDNTERPETVTQGTNELVGTDHEKLSNYIEKILTGNWKKGSIPDRWDGEAGDRIVKHIISQYSV